MKFNPNVSSSRPKARKAHFTAPSHIRRNFMSASLSKELREKHSVKSMPVRKGDEVVVVRGGMKDKAGKVLSSRSSTQVLLSRSVCTHPSASSPS